MSIYAISDLHLSFGVNKPMNIFGEVWENYEEQIKNNWKKVVQNDDIVIIPGDISWAMTLEESVKDFEYIDSLPGKKIILKGNHDYYFSTVTKMKNFFKENGFLDIDIIYNTAIETPTHIICGTRGWGKTDENSAEEDNKIIAREEIRLTNSLIKGKELQIKAMNDYGVKKPIICAFHFPPFVGNFQKIMEDYNVKICAYGHLHGNGHKKIREGKIGNIEYRMVGCDFTGMKLVKLV